MELLLLLASDAIEELEMIAKHARRGVHLALYYIVLASSDWWKRRPRATPTRVQLA